MFNKIKETGTLDMDDVTEFAKQYSLIQNKGRDDFDRSVEIEIYEDPMNLDFCNNIENNMKEITHVSNYNRTISFV